MKQYNISILKEITILLKKELLLEWRQKYAINGILLYVISTVLICYLSFNIRQHQLNPATWNALFWIILLFTSISAVAKSFMLERPERFIYYYTLVSPQAIIFSKIIYNSFLMLFISLVCFGFYTMALGNPVVNKSLFLVTILLGAVGFSSTLTMVSSIASKANNSSTLMAILSFPIIIPMLLLLLKISNNAIDGLSVSPDWIYTLIAIIFIVCSVSFLLFPYIWRD